MAVIVEIQRFDALMQRVRRIHTGAEQVRERTLQDAKQRVPGWVATEITKQYGIKKGAITGQEVGTIRVQTDSSGMKFIYKGRNLTPTHFKMSPTVPPAGAYTLKATIIKGHRSTLGKIKKLTKKQRATLGKNFQRTQTHTSDHSPVMLMHARGGTYIPFQRRSTRRSDIHPVKTISLPQMVVGDRTEQGIREAIDEKLGKRIEHHLQQILR